MLPSSGRLPPNVSERGIICEIIVFRKEVMAIHSRKPFTADEPTEFNFDNGNALLVSPAGGNVHGAFLEAVQVTRLEDKDEVSFKSAHIVLSPVQIIAFFRVSCTYDGLF